MALERLMSRDALRSIASMINAGSARGCQRHTDGMEARNEGSRRYRATLPDVPCRFSVSR
jgi:hypothetical protein